LSTLQVTLQFQGNDNAFLQAKALTSAAHIKDSPNTLAIL